MNIFNILILKISNLPPPWDSHHFGVFPSIFIFPLCIPIHTVFCFGFGFGGIFCLFFSLGMSLLLRILQERLHIIVSHKCIILYVAIVPLFNIWIAYIFLFINKVIYILINKSLGTSLLSMDRMLKVTLVGHELRLF